MTLGTDPSGDAAPGVESPLLDLLVERGGVTGDYHGGRVVRHFGDPAGEYAAATSGVAVFDRGHRARLTVSGRAPAQMLGGVLTGTIPRGPADADGGVRRLAATYHAVLTPKGKMVTDLRAALPGTEEDPGFLLDVPVAGRAGLLAHLKRVLPPRLAKLEDVSARTGALSLVGPAAAGLVARLVLGLRVEPSEMEAAPEGSGWMPEQEGYIVIRTHDVWPPAFDVHGDASAVRSLWERAVEAGAVPAGLGVWATLRVEAGRPAFGTDMDESTIPVEAGIHDRAIDHTKGCYTGQEVIVRIRDRGHVNRQLRLLDLGDAPSPAPGAELLGTGDAAEKVVGHVTSAVQSPRSGGALALAYVRRGVDLVTLDGRTVAVPARDRS